MQELLSEILNQVKPSKQEEKEVKDIVRNISKKIKINKTKIVLGGSGAKNTWLRGTHDIDLYAKFNYDLYKDKDISSILEQALRRNFKIEKLHGSRDYFQIKYKDFTIEIIPILDIKNVKYAKNITDISPFHATFVKKHKKSDDIRLAKAFCIAQSCYGAESYIRGFSGYALEILVIHYGSFINLIKNAAKWKSKTFIGNKNLIKKLNKSKKISPLILIDPVDKNRNVTAALSEEKYKKFITVAKKFLKKPNKSFFEKKEFNIEELKKGARNNKLIIINVEPLEGKKDVIGSKLLKCLNYINKRLELEGFKVLKYSWHWNKRAIFWFILDKKILPEYKKHFGPIIKDKNSLLSFKNKWVNYKIYKEKNRVYVKIKRIFRKPEHYLENLIKTDQNIKKLVKKTEYEAHT